MRECAAAQTWLTAHGPLSNNGDVPPRRRGRIPLFPIIGIVLLFGLVFGSFIMTGGNLGVVIEAAPHELMCILGAGIAGLLIANSMPVLKNLGAGFGKVFKGASWKPADYRDL